MNIRANVGTLDILGHIVLRILKGTFRSIGIMVVIGFMFGCSGTQDRFYTTEQNALKYISRCTIHEKSSEENLTKSEHNSVISTKAPKYPVTALKYRIEGYAKLEFDISKEGRPVNINVIEAFPSNIFNAAAIESLSDWKYQPVASKCNNVQLEFTLGLKTLQGS